MLVKGEKNGGRIVRRGERKHGRKEVVCCSSGRCVK